MTIVQLARTQCVAPQFDPRLRAIRALAQQLQGWRVGAAGALAHREVIDANPMARTQEPIRVGELVPHGIDGDDDALGVEQGDMSRQSVQDSDAPQAPVSRGSWRAGSRICEAPDGRTRRSVKMMRQASEGASTIRFGLKKRLPRGICCAEFHTSSAIKKRGLSRGTHCSLRLLPRWRCLGLAERLSDRSVSCASARPQSKRLHRGGVIGGHKRGMAVDDFVDHPKARPQSFI